MPPSEDSHEQARRRARVIVADLALYHAVQLGEAVRAANPKAVLGAAWAEAEATYAASVSEDVRRGTDYLSQALDALLLERRTTVVTSRPEAAPRPVRYGSPATASLGIDFGTCTMVAAVREGQKTAVLPDATGDEIVPSTVAFMGSGRVIVGRGAHARRIIDPKNTLYSVKRILGRKWGSPEVEDFKKRYPFELEAGPDEVPRFVTRAGKLTPTEVMRHVLASVSQRPAFAQHGIVQVCFSVPCSFGEEQRRVMAEAVRETGFGDVLLVEEPRAAAAPYLNPNDSKERLAAIYDLGGGTFDLGIVKIDRGDCHVLAVGGDSYLGGDDIDFHLANWVADTVLERDHWDIRSNPTSLQTLLFACERAKIRLSEVDTTTLPLGQIDLALEGKDIQITRAQLERLCGDLVRRTFIICDEVLGQLGNRPSDIDMVILAGGGSYMPAIRRGVEHYFGKPARSDVPPDRAVAMGAASLRL